MPSKKKPPTIISGPQFNGTTDLDEEDYTILAVDGFGNPSETILADINWSEEIVCLTGIRLTPDNSRVANSSVFLLGSLFADKRVNITKLWNLDSQTHLSLTVSNASIFNFPNGAMFSDYVDSSATSFKVTQHGSELSHSTLASLNFLGFSLRAHLAPVSATYIKLWISLLPLPKLTLLETHPLASNPSFPGFKVLEGDIPLAPLSSGPPLSKDWGCPITPAILLGSDLNPDAVLPSNLSLITALAAMLRKPVRPELHTNGAKLAPRLEEILEHGSSQLKSLAPEHLWPLPLNPGQAASSSTGSDQVSDAISTDDESRETLLQNLREEIGDAALSGQRRKRKSIEQRNPTAAKDTSIIEDNPGSTRREKRTSVEVIQPNLANQPRPSQAEFSSRSMQNLGRIPRIREPRILTTNPTLPVSDDEDSNFAMLEDTLPEDARMLSHKKDKINKMSWEGVMKLVELRRKTPQLGDGSSQFSRDSAPKPKIFKQQEDDGINSLHEARFERLPLSDVSSWWEKVPIARTHLYKNIPLKFMGAQNKVSEKTIGNLHDRSKPLTLKNFFTQNVCVAAKPVKRIERKGSEGLEMLYDYAWEDPCSLAEVTDSILNYITVLHQLWPYDPTGVMMFRVINKYKWITVATELKEKVSVITAFFNAVLQDNAGRSVREETILNFKEQEEILKSSLVAHNLPSTVPTGRSSRADLDRGKGRFNANSYNSQPNNSNSQAGHSRSHGRNHSNNTVGNNSGNNGGNRRNLSNTRPRASFNNLGVCHGFNNDNCKNPTTQHGCKSNGRELAHVCNVWVDAQKGFCLAGHPRTKH